MLGGYSIRFKANIANIKLSSFGEVVGSVSIKIITAILQGGRRGYTRDREGNGRIALTISNKIQGLIFQKMSPGGAVLKRRNESPS